MSQTELDTSDFEEVETVTASVEEKPKRRRQTKKAEPETSRRVKVVFHNTNEDSGPIFAQVNGHAIQIKREEEVEIREEHLKLLDQCMYTKYDGKRKTGQVDDNGEPILEDVWRNVKRFPYTRM
jgi:hypothetical protein